MPTATPTEKNRTTNHAVSIRARQIPIIQK